MTTHIEWVSAMFQCAAFYRNLFSKAIFKDEKLDVKSDDSVVVKKIVTCASKEADYFLDCIMALEKPLNCGYIDTVYLGIGKRAYSEVYYYKVEDDIPSITQVNDFKSDLQSLELPSSKSYDIWVTYNNFCSIANFEEVNKYSSVNVYTKNIKKYNWLISYCESSEIVPLCKSFIDTPTLKIHLNCESNCKYDDAFEIGVCKCGRRIILVCYGYIDQGSTYDYLCFKCSFGEGFKISFELKLLMYVRYTYYFLSKYEFSFNKIINLLNLEELRDLKIIKSIFNHLLANRILIIKTFPSFAEGSLEFEIGCGILKFPIEGIVDFDGNKLIPFQEYYFLFFPSASIIHPYLHVDLKIYTQNFTTLSLKGLKEVLLLFTTSIKNTAQSDAGCESTELLENSLIVMSQQWNLLTGEH